MNIFKITKEANLVVENYVDDMLFYLNEYADTKAEMETIAHIFCEAYINIFYKIISELWEDEEIED